MHAGDKGFSLLIGESNKKKKICLDRTNLSMSNAILKLECFLKI